MIKMKGRKKMTKTGFSREKVKRRAEKIGAFMLAAFFVLSLSACASDKNGQDSGADGITGNSGQNSSQGSVTKVPVIDNGDLTGRPVFSEKSGFYSSDFNLEITSSDPNAKIYYTLDGSIPDESDTLYTAPIIMKDRTSQFNKLSAQTGVNPSGDYVPDFKVPKGNVVRAMAVLGDGTKTEVNSATYFVGINREEEYGDVPVISMMTDFENLFGYEEGIYVMGKTYDDWIAEDPSNKYKEGWQQEGNFKQKGREWEREALIEYMPADGSEGFSQNAGIRIMGAASRGASQKSFRVISREEYQAKTFEYELISDNERSDGNGNVEKYKSFLLRNGGNDNEFGRLRDPYLQSLVAHRSFETMQYEPVIVYINGEYWGMYTLREDYSDNYIKHNYGLDNKNVLFVKRGELEDGNEEDMYLYYDMFDFITQNDMSVPENYQKACELLDMESFTQYVAFNMYIYNQDSFFDSNNYAMWRCVEPDPSSPYGDGKWRMMAYDTDYSTGIYSDGGGYQTNNIRDIISKNKQSSGGWRYANDILISLLKNDSFKKDLILTLCDMRNVDFEKGRASEILDEMDAAYIKLMPDTLERFGPQWVLYGGADNYFKNRMDQIKNFMSGRYDCFTGLVKEAFGLGDTVTVTVSTSDTESGKVIINCTELSGMSEMTGEYFTDYPIELTAVPAEGNKFVRWECEGLSISDEKSESITVELSADCTVKAVFE